MSEPFNYPIRRAAIDRELDRRAKWADTTPANTAHRSGTTAETSPAKKQSAENVNASRPRSASKPFGRVTPPLEMTTEEAMEILSAQVAQMGPLPFEPPRRSGTSVRFKLKLFRMTKMRVVNLCSIGVGGSGILLMLSEVLRVPGAMLLLLCPVIPYLLQGWCKTSVSTQPRRNG